MSPLTRKFTTAFKESLALLKRKSSRFQLLPVFFYQGGYDISREAFMACHHNQESEDICTMIDFSYGADYTSYGGGYVNDTSGNTTTVSSADVSANTNDKFFSDLMAFWDTYLVYTDDEFSEYLYEFPKYVAEKYLEASHGYKDPNIWNFMDDTHQSAS
jgi:hypothetical protein